MSTKVQLIGGNFQDSEGNLLVNGYLKMRLNQDEIVNSNTQVCSGVEITIQLDSNGNVASSTSTPSATNQFVWGNDQFTPVNSFYRVTGYKSNGQPAWGPNNQQVIGNGGTFDVGTWIPNSVFSWTPPTQSGPTLRVNGVLNNSQSLLNLVSGKNVTVTDNGAGAVSFSSPNDMFSPDVARFSLMEAQSSPVNGAAAGPLLTNDSLTTTDSGANNVSTNPPTASSGPSATYSVVGGGFGHLLRVYQGQFWIYPGRKLTIRGTVRFNFDISAAAGEHYVGVSDTGGGAAPVTGGILAIGVEKITLASGNWTFFVGNAGTVTRVDTGIVIVPDQRYKFELVLSSGTATISIDGVPCGTASTNLPTAPLSSIWFLHGSAGGSGGTCFASLEYLYVENATP